MRYPFFLLWLLLLLTPSACQSKPPERLVEATSAPGVRPASSTPPPTRETPPVGGGVPGQATFLSSDRERPIVGGLVDPKDVPWYSLTPHEPLAYLLSRYTHRSLLDPLTGADAIAESWALTGARATFTLAGDATWSDGTTLRAADVADLILQAAAEGELTGVAGARALDERRVAVELLPPLCPSLMRVATWPLVDVREWPPMRSSSGLTVEEEAEGDWIWGASRLRYRQYQDEVALRTAWEKGEINTILGSSALTFGPLSGPLEGTSLSGPLLATLLFRVEDPLLQSRPLREALTLATDRAALFSDSYGFETEAVLTALLPPGHWAAPLLAPRSDRERAATLLTEAGWRDRNGDGIRENSSGEPLRLALTLPLSADQRWEQLGKSLAEQWATVGVELRPRYLESYSLQEQLHTERWQVALLAYRVAPDPDQRALWSTPALDDLVANDLNITGYHNSAVTELMAQGAQLPGCDPDDRAPFYHEAWRHLLQERPLWPLFALPLDAVQRPGVVWPEAAP